jgi:hypothetical protein
MNVSNIILGVIVILVIYYIISYLTVKTTLTNTNSAKDKIEIKKDDLETNDSSPASNFTYSIWFYIDDWNYRYGQPKIVFGRVNKNKEPQPSVTLGATRNDVVISLSCYPSVDTGADKKSVVHNCKLQNIPIQKWNNLLFSVYGKSMDVYLDGKLTRTCMLPGTAKVTDSSNLFVTPAGGFSGQTAKLQYWDSATNPQQAYNIYKSGFGGGFSLLDKYKVVVSMYADDEETGSITI